MRTCTANNAREMFMAVYNNCHTAIPYYANYFLDDREECRDISADSFIKLWVKRESFTSTEKMSAYVRKCTRNACLTHLRAMKRQQKRNYDYIQHYCPDVIFDLLETDPGSKEDALIRVIQSLDERHRQCMLLYYVENMTRVEIAGRLNISERNVRFFLDKAREIIRSALRTN